MKRLWLGIGVLLVLLGLGLGAIGAINGICGPISGDLKAAARAAQGENWEEALTLSQRARDRWERWAHVSASLTNHEPMEQIEALFQALEIYGRQRDSLGFSDCSARLASLTEAIAEAQGVYWWSIL